MIRAISIFLILFLLIVSKSIAGELVSISSINNILELEIKNNSDISAFNLSFNETPTKIELIGTTNKILDWHQNNMIIYGLDPNIVLDGTKIKIYFDLNIGKHEIKINNLKAANLNANLSNLEIVGDLVVSNGFLSSELASTVDQILGRANEGIDSNDDGVIDIRDVELMSKNIVNN